MKDLKNDCSAIEMHDDYENVGKFAFITHQLPGVIHPQCDFPSMKWLNITKLEYSDKWINRVRFEQLLAVIPQCPEDTSGGDFEDWIYNFIESRQRELYINFPL